MINNKKRFARRVKKVRARISGTSTCPRLAVYRSNRYVSVQAIDDEKGVTIASSSEKQLGDKAGARDVGMKIAELLLAKKIDKVVFDRRGYRYHGRIKSLADAAREKGLIF